MTKHTLLIGVSLAATLLVAGCANGPDAEVDPEVAYPIAVGPHMETLAVTNDAGSLDRVNGYASAFLSSGNGSITLSAPNPDAAKVVAGRLEAAGVPRDRIVVGAPTGASGAVQLSYVAYGANSPACDNWEENIGFTERNLPTPNFGCASQHNLAAQIADPRDLVSPQPMTPPDTERRMTVIDKWRRGEPTSSTKTMEQSGAVSEVGHP